MYVQSNDLFFAPISKGLELYPDGKAPRQAGPNTGDADSNELVRLAQDENLKETADYLKVTISNNGLGEFKVKINVLENSTTPLAPGVYSVFNGKHPIFILNMMNNENGLMELAEDGNPSHLLDYLENL